MNTSTKPDTILMLHGSSDVYGASKILLITATLLKDHQYKVLVVLSEDGPLADQLKKNGIDVLFCRLGVLRRKYFSPQGLVNRLKVLKTAQKRLKEIIRTNKVDVIYSNTTAVLVGALVAKQCKIKHVWHVHEIITQPKLLTRFIGYCLNRFSDQVITVSQPVRQHWAPYVDGSKLITIHNGLDYEEFTKTSSGLRQQLGLLEGEVLIGMIGRINRWKGQKYFLRLASLLAARHPNVKFLMVGDAYPGDEYLYDEIKQIIVDHHLTERVHNLGFRPDVANVFAALDIFVLPSILPDPLPTVVLEAMAASKPVVATAHGGALEMVDDGNTGVLIPWDDSQTAVDRFDHLISDSDLRTKMGLKGSQRVFHLFSKERYVQSVLNLIETLRSQQV